MIRLGSIPRHGILPSSDFISIYHSIVGVLPAQTADSRPPTSKTLKATCNGQAISELQPLASSFVDGFRHNKDSEVHSGVIVVAISISVSFKIPHCCLFFFLESYTTDLYDFTTEIYDLRATTIVLEYTCKDGR